MREVKTDPTAYYATAAQVLPVLALIVIFELRVFGDWGEYWQRGGNPEDAREIPVSSALIALFYAASFLVGEMGALSAVYDGKPSSWDKLFVPTAIYLYLVIMFIIPMQMHAEALFERTPLRHSRLWVARRIASRRERRERKRD